MSDLKADNIAAAADRPSYGDVIAMLRLGRVSAFGRAALTTSLVLPVLIAVIWLATRPYRGVFHDGRFYAVEALNILLPRRFSTDPYFQSGSQGNFTIYTRLYAPLISLLGLSTAAMITTIAGQLLWLCALFRLAVALVRDRTLMLLSIAAVIGLPADYGMTYGEAWVTPRLFVEGLTLLALGYLVRRRPVRALLMLGIAAPLHPLMTLPGLAFVLVYLALDRPLWWAVMGGGAAVALALALTGIQPFANLLAVYDPQWFDVVRYRDAFCLMIDRAAFLDLQTINTVTLAVMGLIAADARGRRLLVAGLIVGLGGVVCTFVGGDLFRDVFVVEIQPWRAMWLIAVIANLYAVTAFLRLVREGDRLALVRLAFLSAAVPLVLSQFLFAFDFVSAPVLVITAGLALWQLRTCRPLPTSARLLGIFAIEASWAGAIFCCYGFKLMSDWTPDEFRIRATSAILLFASLAAIVALVKYREQPGHWLRRATPFVAASLLAAAVFGWDARTAWARFIESPQPTPPSLANLVPQSASVYWEDGLEMLWFRLKRPSYFSCDQGTGSLFYRGTAMEYWNRAQSFSKLRTPDFGISLSCAMLDEHDKADRTRTDLAYVCNRERSLDYVVLARPIAEVRPYKVWVSPARLRGATILNGEPSLFDTDQFYVYACADMR